MGLGILFIDELIGFGKSKVMLFLWLGMPILTILIKWFSMFTPSNSSDTPTFVIASLVVSSIGGTLSSIMLVVSIIHEKSKKIFDMFLTKPIKRKDLILSKFFAVFVCVTTASALSLITGLIVDLTMTGSIPSDAISVVINSMAISSALIITSSSAAVLIGVIADSVLVGVILIIYGGNQVAGLSLIPTILNLPNKTLFTMGAGIFFCIMFLGLAINIFNKKQF